MSDSTFSGKPLTGNQLLEASQQVREEAWHIGFQAGLKRATEIAVFLGDTRVDGLEDTASQSERDYAERKALEIQQAILKEIIP